MKHTRILQVAIFAWLACVSPAALAQVTTVSFDLNDVWLLPDISHPSAPAQQMTGSFDWTYELGDFEGGSGQFTDLSTPWYDPGIEELNITIELTSIEFSLRGSYHDLGLDLTLFLLEPLSPDQPAAIDTGRSMFEIQRGIIYRGHVVSGSVVPISDPCPGDLDGDADVDLSDLAQMLANYGLTGGAMYEQGDLDGDGDVDLGDLAELLAHYGQDCP
jgi:hypothetical protein